MEVFSGLWICKGGGEITSLLFIAITLKTSLVFEDHLFPDEFEGELEVGGIVHGFGGVVDGFPGRQGRWDTRGGRQRGRWSSRGQRGRRGESSLLAYFVDHFFQR